MDFAPPATDGPRRQRVEAAPGCKIFVGNLSWSATNDTLHETFKAFGDILDCIVLRDRLNGRSRGFGFVTFDNTESAQKAIETWNGNELIGRPINVNLAQGPN